MSVIEFSVRRPIATSMFFLAIVFLGLVSGHQLPIDLLPDIAYPVLAVRTHYSDSPPREVEEWITVPLEQSLSTVTGVHDINSVSRESESLIILEFAWGTDMDYAALEVREKIDKLRWALPEKAERPTIVRQDPRSQPVMTLAVSGGDLIRLKALTQNVIKRRLEQIEGVASAIVTGGLEREIHIEPDMAKLTALGISIEDVARILSSENVTMPGGAILKGRYSYPLQTVGEFQNIQDLGDVTVAQGPLGSPISLKEIAWIENGFKKRDAMTRHNGQEAIGVSMTKVWGSNSVDVSKRVHHVLKQLRQQFPDIHIFVTSDQAEFIKQALSTVWQAILIGGMLAFMILFLFLHDAWHPVCLASSIPVAVLAAFTLLFVSGTSLNLISLGGLALGIGMLVDNSIVVLENIFRHRENGASVMQAAVLGAREVAMPVTASTLTTISVFLPVIYLSGRTGQLLRDQSLAVTFSLLTSLLASLTFLPMLAAMVMRKSVSSENKIKRRSGNTKCTIIYSIWRVLRSSTGGLLRLLFSFCELGFHGLTQRYERMLGWALLHRRPVFLSTLAVFLLSIVLATRLDRQVMPVIDERSLVLEVRTPPGVKLDEVIDIVSQVERILVNHPSVRTVFSQVGTAVGQTSRLLRVSDAGEARIRAGLEENTTSEQVLNSLRPSLAAIPGCQITSKSGDSPLTQFFGASEPEIAVTISGKDQDIPRHLLSGIRAELLRVPGLYDLRMPSLEARPQFRIELDRESLGRFGVLASDIARFVRNHVLGSVSTSFQDFDRNIDIVVRPDSSARDELADLLEAQMIKDERPIPVHQFLRGYFTEGPTEIYRENQIRQIRLTAKASKRAEAIRGEIRSRLQSYVPPGYTLAVTGPKHAARESLRSIGFAAILSIGLVYMILAAQFESLLYPLIIMLAVPLACIGVVVALFVTGQSLNAMSLTGSVVLLGIVVNDAILKVDFINRERASGASLQTAITAAGLKRLRPILMTTVTTILGLLPMAIGFGEGAELRQPLAIAIIGGLLSSTLLTLFIVPALYAATVPETETSPDTILR